MTILFWIAAATLILTILAALDLIVGNRSVAALRDLSPDPAPLLPRVSIIVAARNEQRNIREALQSLLHLGYPDYELIVVDDRSGDETGRILDEMAVTDSRLRVIHVEALPPGWLGKNHALWIASRRACGDLLLFTDADIIMEPTLVTRAVTYLKLNGLDHLAATPSIHMPTTFLGMFGTAFIVFFSLFSRPWKARDPKSLCHIGIGAFNLVKTSVYRQVGGHETIRLRPDDDIKLGKIIKRAGFHQDVVYAPDFMTVEWYASLREVIRGLEKNAFSGADYSIPRVLGGALLLTLGSIWPFAAIFLARGAVQGIYLATAALIMLAVADSARFHRARPWHAIGYPLTATLFVFILLRTMALNLWQGGIYWRGTFYPLKELKANRIPRHSLDKRA
ncbi:glycosyltransferase family 2 protein [Geobacter sp. AOG1]|uniref:glycosyltransferase n=1 Tax=Geobacter sp. AOG1 TaxID=1566346 RepID=UPI001CC61380|nr:glycosyltransferase family 2 protein [Geobacter sp. AOG1]GFE56866.1 glycosyl transferase [Geobacter sp. AOG1]